MKRGTHMTLSKKRTIKIVKGQELNIHVSNDICCEQSYMNPAYRQATRALMEIIRQTSNFHKITETATDTELTNYLFQYSGNVIMFDAQRGGGKTRTMLSFANILSNHDERMPYSTPQPECLKHRNSFLNELDQKRLSECRFLQMSPIAPSALEGTQNILYVVLSRLYNYAESILRSGSTCDRINEREKSELFQAFHRCLSGINGIKQPNQKALGDITSLQDISDGIALRKHFYDLVQSILRIAAPREGAKNRFLILQMDDADSQISSGYEVLEDVRKYLVIPNLVILISADAYMLHNVILQDHLGKFPALIAIDKEKEIVSKELSKTCRKYIDKLIPPSHMIHLPQLDKFVEVNGNRLDLEYVFYDELDHEVPVLNWVKDGNWNLQNIVLMLIYRKTGVVFANPSGYLHNIIPRTLRGLNQLVYLLSEMEDIPKVDTENISDIPAFVEAIQAQLPVMEENLSRFVDYFTNEWIGAKIKNFEDRDFLREFCKTAGSNRVRLAIKHLKERYNYKEGQKLRDDRLVLDTMMVNLEQNHRTQDDFLLFFSIRTLLSLESHRLILLKKKETIHDFNEKIDVAKQTGKTSELSPIVFDFNPDQLILPKSYLTKETIRNATLGTYSPTGALKDKLEELGEADKKHQEMLERSPDILPEGPIFQTFRIKDNDALKWFHTLESMQQDAIPVTYVSASFYPIVSAAWDLVKSHYSKANEVLDFFGNTMVNRNVDGTYSLDCLNLITFMLQLGNPLLGAGVKSDKPESLMQQQRIFYRIQETALLIAANWDVQGRIYKRMRIRPLPDEASDNPQQPKDATLSTVKNLYALFNGVDEIIQGINGCEFAKYIHSTSEGNPCKNESKLSVVNAYKDLFVLQKVSLSISVDPLADFFEMMFNDKIEKIEQPEDEDQTGKAPVPPAVIDAQ